MSSKSAKNTSSEPAKPATGSRRNVVLAAIVAVIVAAAAVAIVAGCGGDDDKSSSSGSTDTSSLKAVAETKALFKGIPQKGNTLGKADAPVTMFEFIDYQCPFCRQYALSTYPELVAKEVRDGKLKIVTRPLAFIGPDSRKAARAAAAAAEQNKEFEFTQLFYNNQGQENSGYVTDAYIDKALLRGRRRQGEGQRVPQERRVPAAADRGAERRREVRRREHSDVRDGPERRGLREGRPRSLRPRRLPGVHRRTREVARRSSCSWQAALGGTFVLLPAVAA